MTELSAQPATVGRTEPLSNSGCLLPEQPESAPAATPESSIGVELTKKGDAYLFRHSIDTLVYGSDYPVPASRKAIEERIEALIEMLDVVDDDPDVEETGDDEPYVGWTGEGRGWPFAYEANDDREQDNADREDGGDDEPTLGAPEKPLSGYGGYSDWDRRPRSPTQSQEHWAAGERGDHEREVENEHGGDVLDEPHDGQDQGDDEPFMGWPETCGQGARVGVEISVTGYAADPDDTGSGVLHFEGDGRNIAHKMLRNIPRRHDPDVVTILRPGVALVSSTVR